MPVVDISGWQSGSPSVRAAIAAELGDACRQFGFMQVRGHGIPVELQREVRAAAEAFFDLPLEEKLRVRPPSPDINRGYAAMGTEALAYSLGVDTPPDLFEAFNIGIDSPPSPADDPVMFAANIWPERPAALRPILESYLAIAGATARRLTEVMAVALGLPVTFFLERTDRGLGTLRVNSYRRRAGEPDPQLGQMRMGAHTDYGIVTVLLADPVPGLQILTTEGDWLDVVPDPGNILVNLGDALAVWTNDHWRSTLHRVAPPPRNLDGEVRRYSFAYFHDGNLDAVVECLPSCCSADDPPKYAPVTLGDHLRAKILGPRTLSSSSSTQTVSGRTVT